uniref:Uncharacterized protein n=1 Tax=Sarcophilus harrisii TaxID=9305 RepID=G3W0H3_SARHA
MTEDHGLRNGDGPIEITKRLEFLIPVIAHHIILFNGVQCLFFSFQFDDIWVWDNFSCKFPHRLLKISSKKIPCPYPYPNKAPIPLDSYTLILMALGGYHYISFIKNKHFDLLGIDEFQLGAPIQDSARSTNHNLFTDLLLKFRIKFAHLFNHLSCLKCELISMKGKEQILHPIF